MKNGSQHAMNPPTTWNQIKNYWITLKSAKTKTFYHAKCLRRLGFSLQRRYSYRHPVLLAVNFETAARQTRLSYGQLALIELDRVEWTQLIAVGQIFPVSSFGLRLIDQLVERLMWMHFFDRCLRVADFGRVALPGAGRCFCVRGYVVEIYITSCFFLCL